MKKIEAIIKPFKLSAVKDALHEIGLSGMTILDVKGFGRQRGQDAGVEKDSIYNDEFHAKIKIERGEYIQMPECSELLAPIIYTIPLQILAYQVACQRGTDLDQPRNLAKSVTVE